MTKISSLDAQAAKDSLMMSDSLSTIVDMRQHTIILPDIIIIHDIVELPCRIKKFSCDDFHILLKVHLPAGRDAEIITSLNTKHACVPISIKCDGTILLNRVECTVDNFCIKRKKQGVTCLSLSLGL